MSTWQTKDGRVLTMSEMEDSHLLRSIAMIARQQVAIALQTPADKAEEQSREWKLSKHSERLKSLVLEAKNRKLQDWLKLGLTSDAIVLLDSLC